MKTFDTKAAAKRWARLVESEMDQGAYVSREEAENTSFAEALDRYAQEITPRKKGARQEGNRIKVLAKHALELPGYLTHRLRLAGCELPLFEPPAVEALFQATQGMPRKVNRLAHYALASAAIDTARTVTSEHVQAAREEVAP